VKAATFYVAHGVGVLGAVIYCSSPEGKADDLTMMDEEIIRYMREEGSADKMDEKSN
jgi:hypothetical protein